MKEIKHFFENTHYHMIDVGGKRPTARRAVAQGRIHVGEEAFGQIKAGTLPKGDALMMAEITGVVGAKGAHSLLPLCHPLGLDQVLVHTELEEKTASIVVYCLASAFAKTGVEMEALAGVNAALLAIYDLTKMVEPALSISDVRLIIKEGGKKGRWVHPEGMPSFLEESISAEERLPLKGISAAVLTVSDRASKGEYEDRSGPVLQAELEKLGATLVAYRVVADEKKEIADKVKELMSSGEVRLIITTGGTGLSPRDVTPDVLAELCDRSVPGLAELLRQSGAQHTKNAWLSRGFVGMRDQTLLITLPGSPKAVSEGVTILKDVLPHAFQMIDGGGHD